MSKRNGDKARFHRERKKKMLRRKRNQELRRTLENNPAPLAGMESQSK